MNKPGNMYNGNSAGEWGNAERSRTSNNGNVGSRVSNSDANLLDRIRELSFVKAELELYLDTHPTCRVALDYYHRTINALDMLMEQYNSAGHLVRAEGSQSEDEWEWVKTPWPWQKGGELTDKWREER